MNFLPASAAYFSDSQGQKARGSGRRPRREERHLSVSLTLTPAGGAERERVKEGCRRRRGYSSSRRAVTLILITKATGVQTHNPLLCPMGVGVGVCVCVCVCVVAGVLHLCKPASNRHTPRPGAMRTNSETPW